MRRCIPFGLIKIFTWNIWVFWFRYNPNACKIEGRTAWLHPKFNFHKTFFSTIVCLIDKCCSQTSPGIRRQYSRDPWERVVHKRGTKGASFVQLISVFWCGLKSQPWVCLLYANSSRVIFMIWAFSFRLSFNLNNNNKQEGEEIFFSPKKKLCSIYIYI